MDVAAGADVEPAMPLSRCRSVVAARSLTPAGTGSTIGPTAIA